MKNFTYKNPSSVEEAVGFLMEPDTVAMGGGTEVSKVDDALAAVDDLILSKLG